MTPRSFIRGGTGPCLSPVEAAAALREAIDVDGRAEILSEVDGVKALAFTLAAHPRGPAIVATTPDGRHLATCADPLAAVWCGFAGLDREAATRAAAPTRRRRSSRGTATGGPVG